MKLAIPSETADGLNSRRSGHFGHAPYFTIVEIENREIKSVDTVHNVDHDTYGCGGVIEYTMTLGIDAILTIGMGMPPLMRFTQGGIKVYQDTTTPMVGDAARAFIMGLCPEMSPDNACRH